MPDGLKVFDRAETTALTAGAADGQTALSVIADP